LERGRKSIALLVPIGAPAATITIEEMAASAAGRSSALSVRFPVADLRIGESCFHICFLRRGTLVNIWKTTNYDRTRPRSAIASCEKEAIRFVPGAHGPGRRLSESLARELVISFGTASSRLKWRPRLCGRSAASYLRTASLLVVSDELGGKE